MYSVHLIRKFDDGEDKKRIVLMPLTTQASFTFTLASGDCDFEVTVLCGSKIKFTLPASVPPTNLKLTYDDLLTISKIGTSNFAPVALMTNGMESLKYLSDQSKLLNLMIK